LRSHYLTHRLEQYRVITALPYEALILLALGIHRFYLIGSEIITAILDHDALNNFSISWIGWFLIISVVASDIVERPTNGATAIIRRYVATKQASLERDSVEKKEVIISIPDAVVETPLPPKTAWESWKAYYEKPQPPATAVNTLANLHFFAFIKASMFCLFMSLCTTTLCVVRDPAGILESEYNLPCMFAASILPAIRCVEICVRGWMFAKREQEWKLEEPHLGM